MKRNKLIYSLVFALAFLGFTSGVNAQCCYVSNGVYKYDSDMSSTICANNMHGSTNLSKEACLAKNNEGKYCCNTTTGEMTNKPSQACTGSSEVMATADECAQKYEYATHQCCNNEGSIIEASSKNTCEITANVSHGYQWRTVYQCASLKKVCCVNGQENSTFRTQEECEGYARNSYVAAIWKDKAQCVGLSETSTRGTVDHIDLSNPYVTTPSTNNTTNTNSTNTDSTNTATQERTGTDTGWGTGSKPTDSTEDMKVDLGCEGMKEVLGLIKTLYNLIRYATPLVLIILGSIDFMKAVMAGKEDDIKKNQRKFVSRLGLAIGVFLLLSVFELIANILDKSGVENGKAWYNCWASLMIMFK